MRFDLRGLRNGSLEDIEKINITGMGDNILLIDTLEINELGGLREGGKTKVIVEGNAGDKVVADGLWLKSIAQRNVETYNLFEQGAYQLLIDTAVSAEIGTQLIIRSADINLAINGGLGFDVLVFDGAGIDLDLTTIDNNLLNNIEGIDMGGTGGE